MCKASLMLMNERKVTKTAQIQASALVVLKIGWSEADRLLQKKEFAAALLVAAINVESVLRDHLRQYKNTLPVPQVRDKDIRSMYGNINGLSLSGCYKVAQHLENYGFKLREDWKHQVVPLLAQRKKIVHERGYFARLTKLEILSEIKIKQLIDNARKFCETNPPTR